MPIVAVIPEPTAPVELRELHAELEPDSALLEVGSPVAALMSILQQGRLTGVPYLWFTTRFRGTTCKDSRHGCRQWKQFREGDRVTFLTCTERNACWYCLVARATTRCPHRRFMESLTVWMMVCAAVWASHYLKPGHASSNSTLIRNVHGWRLCIAYFA
jgi:L-iditol 2-dehydrogenase